MLVVVASADEGEKKDACLTAVDVVTGAATPASCMQACMRAGRPPRSPRHFGGLLRVPGAHVAAGCTALAFKPGSCARNGLAVSRNVLVAAQHRRPALHLWHWASVRAGARPPPTTARALILT